MIEISSKAVPPVNRQTLPSLNSRKGLSVNRRTASHNTIAVDPDAVICWIGHGNCDPEIRADVNWKTFIGQASGESYTFEWSGREAVTVIIQPAERSGGIRLGID